MNRGVMRGAYRALGYAAVPALNAHLARRAARGKEDGARLAERRGIASAARPAGRLVWFHAASVGETMSILPVIERVRAAGPAVLLTTGTITSARLAAERLPEGAIHQFVPLDATPWVRRFFDHWRPDAVVFVESEIWPNILLEADERGIQRVLINARLSAGSARAWRTAPDLARKCINGFRYVHAQSAPDAARLYRFRLPHLPSDILTWGNLKYGIPKLPVDEAALAAFRAALPGPPGAKRAWIAASTHAGEEERVLVAHRILSGQVPDLVTIIAPRHPERGDAVAALAAAEGWQVARRSRGGAPVPGIYLVDTLGELGLFYRAAPVAFVGGSLVSIGGHNVLEPARLGVPVLVGPYTATCEGPVDDLEAAGGLRRVQDAVSLAMGVAALLSHPARARACGRAGQRVAEGSQDLPQRLADLILSTLP